MISSVGRASPLHGGGRRFEPVITHHSQTLLSVVTKWVISSVGRASPLHGGGRRFEPVITHHFGSLAQLVEQLTFNQLVAGSNPARPTNVERCPKGAFLLFCSALPLPPQSCASLAAMLIAQASLAHRFNLKTVYLGNINACLIKVMRQQADNLYALLHARRILCLVLHLSAA